VVKGLVDDDEDDDDELRRRSKGVDRVELLSPVAIGDFPVGLIMFGDLFPPPMTFITDSKPGFATREDADGSGG
jgi:hypothetical protein